MQSHSFFEKNETTPPKPKRIRILVIDDLQHAQDFIKYCFTVINENTEDGYYEQNPQFDLNHRLIKSLDDYNDVKKSLEDDRPEDQYDIYIFDNTLGLGNDHEGWRLAEIINKIKLESKTRNQVLVLGNSNDKKGSYGYDKMSKVADIMLDKPGIFLPSRFRKQSMDTVETLIDLMNAKLLQALRPKSRPHIANSM